MFLNYIRLHIRKMCPHSALRLQMPFHASSCFEHMVQMQSRRDQVRNGVFSPASPCPQGLVFDVLCGDMGLPSNAWSGRQACSSWNHHQRFIWLQQDWAITCMRQLEKVGAELPRFRASRSMHRSAQSTEAPAPAGRDCWSCACSLDIAIPVTVGPCRSKEEATGK